MISATITGVVAADAEIRNPRGGDPVLSFRIASRRYAGNSETATDWVNCSLWGKRGSALASHVTKGSRVAVRGSMHVREYEKTGGGSGWSLELRADDIELLGGPKTADSQAAPRARDLDDQGGADADTDIPF